MTTSIGKRELIPIRTISSIVFTAFMLLLISSFHATGQSASDVLEDGLRVKKGYKIFFRKDGALLKYDINNVPKDFTSLENGKIFLVEKNEVNFYIKPLNPLNFQTSTINVMINDPIIEAEKNTMSAIFNMLESVKSNALFAHSTCGIFDNIKDTMESLKLMLVDDQKEKVIKIFRGLKAIDFEDEAVTKTHLDKLSDDIQIINNHFQNARAKVKILIEYIKGYTCGAVAGFPDDFTGRFIFSVMLKELDQTLHVQETRFITLQKMYVLVRTAQETASKEKDGLKWLQALPSAPATRGNISNYTIVISEAGYELSNDFEITSINPKEVLKYSIKVRRFQKFVPEVSAGIAYTFFEYPQYETSQDVSGNTVVSNSGNRAVNNLKYTAMINYNMFISNSALHPFWQIGIGANAEIPTFLTGIGLRANVGGIRRLALAGGVAFSWIQRLDKLSLGDKVLGTNDIQSDLKYEFNKTKPFYVGIQYNF